MLPQTVRPGRSGLRAALIAAGIGVFASTGAAAAPVVEHWNFTLDNAWTETMPGMGPVTYENINTLLGAPSLIKWGTPFTPASPQSSLEVGESNGHFEGMIETNNMAFVPTVQVTHNNWPLNSPEIGGSPWLTAAQLTDVLTLHPTAPNPPFDGTQTHQPPPLVFEIKFVETSNESNNQLGETGGSCSVTTSPDGGGCNDIFVVQLPMEAFFEDGLLKQNFTFEEVEYQAQILLEGLDVLEDSACAAAGVAAGCIGLTTPENQATSFLASLRILAFEQEVSEPGTLAVLGLGLLGLGYVRRRRHG